MSIDERPSLKRASGKYAHAFVVMRDAFTLAGENEWNGGAIIAHTDPGDALVPKSSRPPGAVDRPLELSSQVAPHVTTVRLTPIYRGVMSQALDGTDFMPLVKASAACAFMSVGP